MDPLTKKIGWVIAGFLLVIIVIEGGMRFAVLKSLNDLNPEGVEYEFYINMTDNSLRYGCTSIGRKDYMNIFYTDWIVTEMNSKVICEIQEPHMTLTVFGKKKTIHYHWSFFSLAFEKDPYN